MIDATLYNYAIVVIWRPYIIVSDCDNLAMLQQYYCPFYSWTAYIGLAVGYNGSAINIDIQKLLLLSAEINFR